MNAAPGERVEVGGQSGDQGLAFARPHFRDLAGVQYHPSDQLHVEVALAENPPRSLPYDRERFGSQIVEVFTFADAGPELPGLGAQVAIGEPLHRGLESVDRVDVGLHFTDDAFVGAAYDLCD